MNYFTAHSEAGANTLLRLGCTLRQVNFVVDGFEYILEAPSTLPQWRDVFSRASLPSSDHVAEGVDVVSIQILSDKSNAQQDSPAVDKVLRISGADALSKIVNLGEDFKGTLRLDFEGTFHDGTVIRST